MHAGLHLVGNAGRMKTPTFFRSPLMDSVLSSDNMVDFDWAEALISPFAVSTSQSKNASLGPLILAQALKISSRFWECIG